MKRVVVLLLVVGCRRQVTPVPEPLPVAPVSVRPAAEAGPSPQASGAHTRGVIACGGAGCVAGKQACVLGAGDAGARCVADDPSERFGSERYLRCDDPSDCADGELCCAAHESPVDRTRCMQPDVADGDPCILQSCRPGDGTPCPLGQACRDGFCRPAVRERATCQGGVQCPAGAEACAWNGARGACAVDGALRCTKSSDCGGRMVCCGIPDAMADWKTTVSECRRACGPLEVQLCDRSSECPPFLVTGAGGGLRPQKCEPLAAEHAPPWVRRCAP